MKYILLLLLTVSFTFGFEYNLKPQKVAEDVYCFFGKLENINKQNAGNMVNTCFVQTKDSFVVVDSGPTFSYAAQAYEQMQKIATLPIKYVILTHDHDDHWLGNSFYKSKGALLIGPRTYEQNVVVGMKTRMEQALGKTLYGNTKIVSLDTIVDNNLTLKVSDKTFEIKQVVTKAHTEGDLLVYLPHSNGGVVFAGDLVFNDRVTSIRDGSLIGSLKVLDEIDALKPKVILGGHGYATDGNATKSLRAYLTQMKKEVQKALDDDVSIEEVTKKVLMPEYKKMKLYDVLQSRNVFVSYQELEMLDEDEE
ncbi:MAG: MBL fold metallo-hydrolase [Campylobacterota bacterium]|nr:MBL fold metallo-hydrolase [Campylobacterota bacterium]